MINNLILKRRLKIKKPELNIIDRKTPFWKPLLYLLPFLAIVFLFTILPFFMSLEQAFVSTDPNRHSVKIFGIRSFQIVITDPRFIIGFRNSLVYALISLPLTLLISISISAAISHIYSKLARGFWQTLFFLPYVTNGVAIAASFVYFFDSQIGIVNLFSGSDTRWLDSGFYDSWNPFFVILSNGVWSSLAFQIVLLTTAMLSVNKTLYKAASVDGAPRWKQFFKITLPTIKGTLNLIITLGIIGGIRVLPIAIFNNNTTAALSNGGSTIMLYIYSAIGESKYSIAGAATVYMFLIGISFTIILKNSIKLILIISTRTGERRVYNKIKNSKII